MRVLQLGLLLALTSGIVALLIYITGVSYLQQLPRLSDDDFEALQSLQRSFQNCVSANGLGLQAAAGKDVCKVTLRFPSDTVSKWKDPKTGEIEDLSFDFNLCEALATWEQVRNSTTILTKEFIDALPNGWEDYAWHPFNKGIILNRCENKTLCLEKLSLVLPKIPPYYPRQFDRCAVIGNSGDLLKTKFGDEIDGYNVVIRENGAPIQEWPYTPTWTSLLPDDGVLGEFMSSFVHIKLIKIHSPMRADPNRVVKSLPSYDKIIAARMASEKILR
ncbi:hypothetical protein SAY87_003207 [Trapa incisa]|uniref:Uncharacterized protein n=1 Tax=Trapa incisa TaxID=236973 RepID=A0AAN7KQI9_9MYRT|nr:hypothetical protein SAY87_003207 [Trapa incisa]